MKPMVALRQYALPIFGIAVLGILVRSPVPLDETRYLAVAWDMWLNQDWLVPHLNGAPYSQKPPLLFWMISAGWHVFGVVEWWPRLLPAIASWLSLGLTAIIAKHLNCPNNKGISVAIIFGAFAWPLYSTALLFDMLMALWSLLGWVGLLKAAKRERFGWTLTTLSIGLGVLTKGPVILLYILPPGLLAPFFLATRHPRLWYLKLLGSALGGAAIALAWALPAAAQGGEAYANDILWGQTAGRMQSSFSHDHPWWWYFPILFALFFPWSFWPGFWKRLRPNIEDNSTHLFLLASCFLPFAIFCAMSGKQPHYLLPLLPIAALAIAFHPDSQSISPRIVRLKWLAPALLCVLMLVLPPLLLKAFQVKEMASKISTLQAEGYSILHAGKYHGDFQFVGRLKQPLQVRKGNPQIMEWIEKNPEGYILISDRKASQIPTFPIAALESSEFVQPYRSGQLHLIAASQALSPEDGGKE